MQNGRDGGRDGMEVEMEGGRGRWREEGGSERWMNGGRDRDGGRKGGRKG